MASSASRTPQVDPTHDVHPHHEVLQNGVRFNVQTVPSRGKPLKLQSPAQTATWVNRCARNACDLAQTHPVSSENSFPKIEQHSIKERVLVVHHARSLMEICLTAFAFHYPLALSPDHIWLAIAYGAAKHIDKNAEALRSRFVSFQGKKTLTVRKDDAVMGHVPAHEWESDVFREFSTQIRGHIGKEIHQIFAAPFSTTSKADLAAAEIILMSATAHYFDFEMLTLCGIPFIELEGTVDDWIELRRRAAQLHDIILPDFAHRWLTNLLPVLDEFVSAYKGNVNHAFWQRMVKKYEGSMSGETPVLSGWINNLYPYLSDGNLNPHMKPWVATSQFCGPEPSNFPVLVASAAVQWEYYETKFPLHFHAGYFGMTQNPETRALRPHIGWIITHDNEKQESKNCRKQRAVGGWGGAKS